MPLRRAAHSLAAALLGLAAGCGPSTAEVSGAVTVDGQPLAEGQIIFEAADGLITPAAGAIQNGKYTLTVLPGAKKVRVTASRPTRKADPVLGAAARESAVAAEYNERTTLTADVKPGANPGVDFAVKAAP